MPRVSKSKVSPGAKAEGLGASKARNNLGAHKKLSKAGKSLGADNKLSVRKRQRKDLPDEQTCRCALVAIASWNKNQMSKGLPQYVVVEPVISSYFKKDGSEWYHASFKARPKDDPASEPELFFVEMKGSPYGTRGREITMVCVLGPADSGVNGCKACKGGEPVLHHPAGGGFNVGQQMYAVDEDVHERMLAREQKLTSKSK